MPEQRAQKGAGPWGGVTVGSARRRALLSSCGRLRGDGGKRVRVGAREDVGALKGCVHSLCLDVRVGTLYYNEGQSRELPTCLRGVKAGSE